MIDYSALACFDDETCTLRVQAHDADEARRMVRAELDATDRDHFEIRYVRRAS